MKRVGCCTLCDAEVHEIIDRHPAGHPYEGLPRRLGPPLKNIRRVRFALADGTICDITFCSECEITPERMPEIWRRVLEATAYEESNKVAIRSTDHQTRVDAMHIKLVDAIPLGVISGV